MRKLIFIILLALPFIGCTQDFLMVGSEGGKANVANTFYLRIDSLVLFNASDDSRIKQLAAVDTINISTYPEWSIVAYTPTGVPLMQDTAKSMAFYMDGVLHHVENYSPYAMGGDSYDVDNDYFPVTGFSVGDYELVVIPYQFYNEEGNIGEPDTVQLTLISPTTPTITNTTSPAEVDSGAVVSLSFDVTTTDSIFINVNGSFVDTITFPNADTAVSFVASRNLAIQGTARKNGVSVLSNIVNVGVRDTSGSSSTTITMSNQSITENYPAGTLVGVISPSGGNYYLDTYVEEDGWWFEVRNDSVFTLMAFNREAFTGDNIRAQMPYIKVVHSNGASQTFTITIADNAAWDYNDVRIAMEDDSTYVSDNFGETIRLGDVLVFGEGNNNQFLLITIPSSFNPRYNRVRLMGYQHHRTIEFTNVEASYAHPVIVTNWLGQVETRRAINLRDCNGCRLTGKYDPALNIGHPKFTGEVSDAWKHRTFGIHSNRLQTNNENGVRWTGAGMTDIIVDHLELTDGGQVGIEAKDDNAGGGFVDSCLVDDIYVHDIKNEGIYHGNTKSESTHGPQQKFRHNTIRNMLILRTGLESYQFQRGVLDNTYTNVTTWSGLGWINPFQNNQDGNIQSQWANGGHLHTKGIHLGGNDVVNLVKPRTGESSPMNTEDTNVVSYILHYSTRGNGNSYLNNGGVSNFPPVKLSRIWFGRSGNNYTLVKSNWPNTNKAINFESWGTGELVEHISIDATYDDFLANYSGITVSDTNSYDTIWKPVFDNPFGVTNLIQGSKDKLSAASVNIAAETSFNIDSIHRWHRYFPVIYENTSNKASLDVQGYNVDDPFPYKKHDVLQHYVPYQGRWAQQWYRVELFYVIQDFAGDDIEPGVTPGWENYCVRLLWQRPTDNKIQRFPPDDFNLTSDNYYQQFEMGIQP